MTPYPGYGGTARVLADRIEAFLRGRTEREFASAFDLFPLGFTVGADISPTLGQANAALGEALARLKKAEKPYDIDAANKRQSDFYHSVGGRRAPEDEAAETARGEMEEDNG